VNQIQALQEFIRQQEEFVHNMSCLLNSANRQLDEARDMEGELDLREISGFSSACWSRMTSEALEREFTVRMGNAFAALGDFRDQVYQMRHSIREYAKAITPELQPA
jgi:hypothetical protein